jgi:cell division protein FtsZ
MRASRDSDILVAGVGGLGCAWAAKAHGRVKDNADLLLVDHPHEEMPEVEAHRLDLGVENHPAGCAMIPQLAHQRMKAHGRNTALVLEPIELVILMVGLGGGAGSGAAPELARQARASGALVLSIAALPFESQSTRVAIADQALVELENSSDVCVRLSLDRLAWQARERGSDWRKGASWIEELVDGIVQTICRMGLINLDLMDLRAVVERKGKATMLVAEGSSSDPLEVFEKALRAPLDDLAIIGARSCLLQVEGGRGMTVSQVEAVSNAFTQGLHPEALVILGARMSPELEGRLRAVAVVSGITVIPD